MKETVVFEIDPSHKLVSSISATPELVEKFSRMGKWRMDCDQTNVYFSHKNGPADPDSLDVENWWLNPPPIDKDLPNPHIRFQGKCWIGGFISNPYGKGWEIYDIPRDSQTILDWISFAK